MRPFEIIVAWSQRVTEVAGGHVGPFVCTHRFSRPPIARKPCWKKGGAGEEIRTLDIFLGKEVLYQLSYARV